MKYGVNYQYMSKEDARPRDDGALLDFPHDAKSITELEMSFLPNVGDFVSISHTDGSVDYHGVVKTRYFRYTKSGEQEWCHINIVIENSDFDWGKLIKE